MLTKNFSNIIVAASQSVSTHPNFTDREGVASSAMDAYQYFGNSKCIGVLQNKTLSQLEASTSPGHSVFGFGSGDTEVSPTDITITFIDDSDIVINSVSQSTANNRILLTADYSYNGSGAITISEIGYFMKISTVANSKAALIAREVLNTPMTINSGDTFQVSMIIG